MLKKIKFNTLAEDDKVKIVEELCIWIDQNLQATLGLRELVEKSQLSTLELQYLFEKYKQTTPMTYIRRKREEKMKYYISKERILPIFISNKDY